MSPQSHSQAVRQITSIAGWLVKSLTAVGSFALAAYAVHLGFFPAGLQLADTALLFVVSLILAWTLLAPAALGLLTFLLLLPVAAEFVPRTLRLSRYFENVERMAKDYWQFNAVLGSCVLISTILSVKSGGVGAFELFFVFFIYFVTPALVLLVLSDTFNPAQGSTTLALETHAKVPKPQRFSMKAYALTMIFPIIYPYYALAGEPLFELGLQRAGLKIIGSKVAMNAQYACLLNSQVRDSASNAKDVDSSETRCPATQEFILVDCVDLLWMGIGSEYLIRLTSKSKSTLLVVPRSQLTRVLPQQRCLTPRSS